MYFLYCIICRMVAAQFVPGYGYILYEQLSGGQISGNELAANANEF